MSCSRVNCAPEHVSAYHTRGCEGYEVGVRRSIGVRGEARRGRARALRTKKYVYMTYAVQHASRQLTPPVLPFGAGAVDSLWLVDETPRCVLLGLQYARPPYSSGPRGSATKTNTRNMITLIHS